MQSGIPDHILISDHFRTGAASAGKAGLPVGACISQSKNAKDIFRQKGEKICNEV